MIRAQHFFAALLALALAACGGGVTTPGDDDSGDDTTGDEWDQKLEDREVDYSAALRIAALRLTGELPTLVEVKAVAEAPDEQKQAVYESLVGSYLDSPRFARQMFAWWKDTLKAGDTPELDTAAAFAAQVTVEGRPYTDLLTASTGTCATYDEGAGTFTPADCANGVATHAGLLTHPGIQAQFYSNMAFRRVRWVQETWACTAFPAEIVEGQSVGGAALYTAPEPFESVASLETGGRVNFQDAAAVVCANCHATMNQMAPLFLNFDEDGQYGAEPAVMVPVEGTPLATFADYLAPGYGTGWRHQQPVADLPGLGAAMAADPAIAECAIVRAWNWALGKGDVVETLSTVPSDIIADQVTAFRGAGMNYKDALFAVFTSDDFVKF